MSEREAEFLGLVEGFVREYEGQFGPVSLNIVNRRWGVRCKEALGVSVRDLIVRHPEVFECGLSASGGVTVRIAPKHPLVGLIQLSLGGGPLSEAELRRSLSGTGFTAGEYMEQLLRLRQLGLIEVSEGVYSLVE